jgi:predicted PurR-regulated permease PerM
MLGIDAKTARAVWTAALVVLVLCLVYLIRSTLFIFILALLFAYLLYPLVNLIDRSLPGRGTRTAALALAYIIFIGLFGFLIGEIGSQVVDEANNLAKRFPDIVAHWNQPNPGDNAINWVKKQVGGEVTKWSENLVETIPRAGVRVLAVAGELVFVIVIPILAFFFLKDGAAIREHILELVDNGPRRDFLEGILADTHLLLAHYMRALVGLSVTVFATYGLAFTILGVPYGVLLAAFAAMIEIIPMVGPLTGGVVIVVITAITGGHILAVAIFLIAFRMVQDYVVSPHLMGKGVELHPLLVIFGVFAGAQVAGIAGSFLSVPLLALVRVIYVHVRRARIDARLGEPVQ